MSAWAYVLAANQAVQNIISDPNPGTAGKNSGVRLDGRPPASFGQTYYATWWPGSRTRDSGTIEAINDTDCALIVTITQRLSFSPDDRAAGLALALGGLVGLAEAIAAPAQLPESVTFPNAGVAIAGSYTTMLAANALIPGTQEYCNVHGGFATKNGYTEPLWLLDYGPVVTRPASWVWAKPEEGEFFIYSIDVKFGRGRRLDVGAPQ